MKSIKLISLRLKNFKGIKEQTMLFNGLDTEILGDNATGKTTIADAFNWLLFDKDSSNRKDFEIKPLDKQNNTLHGLESIVEGVLEVEGKTVSLKKIYSEKWTKKRGESERTLTGNTTDYYIDEVPVSLSNYQEYIKGIADEDLFKLITNIGYFNQQLNWQKRRTILLDICGDISDEYVVSKNEKLAGLLELLNGKSIEEFRSMIKAKKKRLNEDIKSIPIRIDEIYLSMTDENECALGNINVIEEKERLMEEIRKIDEAIIKSGSIQESWDLRQKELINKKQEIEQLKARMNDAAYSQIAELKKKKCSLEHNIIGLPERINDLKQALSSATLKIADYEEKVSNLREVWTQTDKEVFVEENELDCPVCKQPLPEEMKNEKISALKDNFEKDKAKRLEEVSSKGKRLTEEIKRINTMKTEYEVAIDKFNKDLEELKVKIEEIEKSLQEETKKHESIAYEEDPVYLKLKNDIDSLEKELLNPEESLTDAKQELLAKKKILGIELEVVLGEISRHEQAEKNKLRIEELRSEEKSLANQIAELEGQEFKSEEFIRTKVSLLEENINSRFRYVKFKLFNTLVNGAIEETCETLIDGVPFTDANSASKINAGLDIINVLTEHFEVEAPVIIDNKESVNELIACRCQTICLKVSKDKKLIVKNNSIIERKGA